MNTFHIKKLNLSDKKGKTTKWKIPLYKVFTDENDIKQVSNVLKRGMDWAIGPEIEKFESSLAQYIGRKYCIAFNSGTSAGHAALIALGINAKSEVIVPSFTFISTANWPLMVQASPKFADIEMQTYGMDPKDLESKISKKTKAVIPIHYGGLPCKINEIKEISNKNKFYLIEDAAESFGASLNGRKIGSFGTVSIFSFAGNKILTTGEGGALCTDSKELYEKIKLIRSHGRQLHSGYFSSMQDHDYFSLGYNWRMSSITAALGLSQLDKIEKIIDMRRNNAKYYQSKLKNIKEISLQEELPGFKHVYQFYPILLRNSTVRAKLMNFLASKGIMTRVFFKPVHKTMFFSKIGYGSLNLPNTEKISKQILALPMFPTLQKEEINYIIDTITKFFESTNK
jgi:perosamine synthetase